MTADIYTWQDYVLAAWVLGALLFWVTVEFLRLRRFVQRVLGHVSGQVPASAQEAAQRVSEASEHGYANTRNARQDMNRGGSNGKG